MCDDTSRVGNGPRINLDADIRPNVIGHVFCCVHKEMTGLVIRRMLFSGDKEINVSSSFYLQTC